MEKAKTKKEVRIKLYEWAQEKEDFKTSEAVEELIKTKPNVFVNTNRIAQYLRDSKSHEYHKGLKRWIRMRN